MKIRLLGATALLTLSPYSFGHPTDRPDSHAPIGVMGDHFHKSGEVMLSYRYMHMDMAGNRSGTNDIAPIEIATPVANRFFGTPGQPPTLRVVPTEMIMDMHMFGVMYAPVERLTLMGMFNYLEKQMKHTTYQGGVGTTELGTFVTRSSGVGDSSISALLKLHADSRNRLHATLGVSLPTGDIKETDEILTPMGMRPSPRLPYPMQLGSGTFDLIAGLSFATFRDRWSFGSQWRSTIRLGENDEGYSLGDEHALTAWASYLAVPIMSISGRVQAFRRNDIDGIDPRIVAPVQTADPDNQAMDRLDLSVGANLGDGSWRGHRISAEFTVPVYQKLDGPQLETDWQIMVGYQYAF
jgi:hypothetical protein